MDNSSTSSLLRLEQSFVGVVGVLQIQVPVVWRIWLCNQPSLVQRLHHFLGERALLQILQVGFELPKAAHPNQNPIAAPIANIQGRVMVNPAQGRLYQRQTMFFDDRLNDAQSFKVRIFEVAIAVVVAGAVLVTVPAFGRHIMCLVFAREESSCKRVIDDDVKAITAAGVNQFGLDVASCCFTLVRKQLQFP